MSEAKPVVLLVEDRPEESGAVREALASRRAFDVEEVSRLSACLDRLSLGNVDAVLLDLDLPDSTGLPTLRRVRERAPGVPVVVLARDSEDGLAAAALHAGAHAVLPRSGLSPDLLAHSLLRAIEDRRRRPHPVLDEQFLRGLADHTHDLVVRVDRELRYVYLSPAVQRMTGAQPGQPIRTSAGEGANDPALASTWETVLAEVFRLGGERELDWEVATPVGARHYRSRLVPELAGDGSVETVLVASHDITTLRQAQSALAARAEQQAAVAALGQRALSSMALSATMDDAVRTVAGTLGVELAKVLELLPSGDRLLLRAGVGWQPGLVGAATVGTGTDSQAGYTLRSNGPVVVEDMAAETRFSGPALLRDHGVVSGISVVITTGEAHPYGVLGAHTARRRAFTEDDARFMQSVANILGASIRRHRAEHEARHRAKILANVRDAVVVADLNGVVTYWNDGAATLFGYTAEEVTGKPVAFLYPEPGAATVREHLAQILAGDLSRLEWCGRCKDGSEVWLDLKAGVLCDARGAPEGFIGVAKDITDRKRAEEAADRRAAQLESLFKIARVLVEPRGFRERAEDVLREIGRAVDVDTVTLRLYEEKVQGLCLIATIGPGAPNVSGHLIRPVTDGISGRAFAERRLVLIEDCSALPDVDPLVRAAGVRGLAALPVIVEGRALGTITVASRREGQLTPDRVRLLESMTNSLGPLLVRALLRQQIESQLAETRRQQESFQSAVQNLALESNPRQALQQVVDGAREVVGAKGAGLILRAPEGPASAWITSGFTLEESAWTGMSWDGPCPGCRLTDGAGRTLLCPALSSAFPPGHPPTKTVLCVPVKPSRGPVGLLYVTDKTDGSDFTDDETRRIEFFAVLARVLVDNAGLYGEVARERSTLAAIQAGMSEGMLVIAPDGRIAYLNDVAARLLDVEAGAAAGRPVAEVFAAKAPDFERRESLEAVLRLFDPAAGQEGRVELALLRPRRREIAVSRFSIDAGLDGHLTGLLLRDVTEERDNERRRDTFVSIAAHELRNPLATLLGFSELLLLQDPPEAKRKAWLTHIVKDGHRLAAILDDLLSISRIQAGTLNLKRTRLELPQLLWDTVNSVRGSTEVHTFNLEVENDLPPVVGDLDKLTQVLTNLLSNAVKYSPSGGRVIVGAGADPQNNRVVVSVSDQGIGIAPEHVERLFSLFFREERREASGVGGTGLGLFIVKALVDAMGGDVWVKSAVGEGSTFFFSLPIAQETA